MTARRNRNARLAVLFFFFFDYLLTFPCLSTTNDSIFPAPLAHPLSPPSTAAAVSSTSTSPQPITILLFGTGAGEYDKMTTVIKSILFHRRPSTPFRFVIVTNSGMESKMQPFISALSDSSGCTTFTLVASAEALMSGVSARFLNASRFITFHYSSAWAISKLFLSYTSGFPSDIERAIYIDTDLLVLRDIEELWSSFDDARMYSVVCPLDPKRVAQYCKHRVGQLCSSSYRWCNTGVMLLNLKRMRLHSDYFEWILNAVKPRLRRSDQFLLAADMLMNIVLASEPAEIGFLGCQWNCDVNTLKFSKPRFQCLGQVCAIVHYVAKNYYFNHKRTAIFSHFWESYRLLPVQPLRVNDSRCRSPNIQDSLPQQQEIKGKETRRKKGRKADRKRLGN